MSAHQDLREQLVRVAERVADRAVETGTPLRRLHFDLARAGRERLKARPAGHSVDLERGLNSGAA